MSFMEQFIRKAQQRPARIVYPEAADERVLRAVHQVAQESIAYPILVGDRAEIEASLVQLDIPLDGIEIVDGTDVPDAYVEHYLNVRQTKPAIARRALSRPLYFAAAMVAVGDADGLVGGVASLTATVVKAAGLVIGLAEEFTIPSSIFVMHIPDGPYGESGTLIYADAGVNIDPNVEELAEIAVASAQTARTLLGWEPRVAMLSCSTKGSASHPLIDKVIQATLIAQKRTPELSIDGEFQGDAALVPEVARRKLKESGAVAGSANVLIFPNLDAGNIAYKLTQYLAGAEAYGPILQGFRKPVNDLSRGATVDDIVGVTAITVVQARTALDCRL